MKHWQSLMKILADNCCLFMCYVEYCGIDPDTLSGWMPYFQHALEKKLIDEESTVLQPEKLIYSLTGRTCTVEKLSLSCELKDIKEKTIVKFSHNGYGHWVIVENGEVIFNSLDYSNCVVKGKITDARIVKMKEKLV